MTTKKKDIVEKVEERPYLNGLNLDKEYYKIVPRLQHTACYATRNVMDQMKIIREYAVKIGIASERCSDEVVMQATALVTKIGDTMTLECFKQGLERMTFRNLIDYNDIPEKVKKTRRYGETIDVNALSRTEFMVRLDWSGCICLYRIEKVIDLLGKMIKDVKSCDTALLAYHSALLCNTTSVDWMMEEVDEVLMDLKERKREVNE